MIKKYLPLFAAVFLASILRVIYLEEIPPGIANDEANIILNAQSFLKTGQNIPGVTTGVIGHPRGDLSGGIHSEISSYLIIPWILLFGFSLPYVKIPFILASLGIVCLSYLLIKKLISEKMGIIAAFLSAVNPWSIHFSRSAYESIFSAFFYLFGIYMMLNLKGWKILWSVLPLLAGFLSYFSAKTLLIPLALSSFLIIKLFRPKDSLKPALILNIMVLIFVLLYSFILVNTPAGGRFGELKSGDIKKLVDNKRTISLSLPFVNLFENKLTEDIKIRMEASLGTLSPNFLFLDGQGESIPSLIIPDHAPLYLIDFPLVILAILFLARYNAKPLILFLYMALITLIPNFLNLAGTTYMIRTVILFPILTILAATGFYYLKSFLPKSIANLISISLITLYLFFFGNFIYQYFARLPIDKNEGWFFHDRVLARYINLSMAENNLPIIISTDNPKHTFYRILFFNNLYTTTQSVTNINRKMETGNYNLLNLTVTHTCPQNLTNNLGVIYIISTQTECKKDKGLSIASLKDGGEKYIISNDALCNPFVNRRYPLIKNIFDLNIENLSKEDFCQKYITNLFI